MFGLQVALDLQLLTPARVLEGEPSFLAAGVESVKLPKPLQSFSKEALLPIFIPFTLTHHGCSFCLLPPLHWGRCPPPPLQLNHCILGSETLPSPAREGLLSPCEYSCLNRSPLGIFQKELNRGESTLLWLSLSLKRMALFVLCFTELHTCLGWASMQLLGLCVGALSDQGQPPQPKARSAPREGARLLQRSPQPPSRSGLGKKSLLFSCKIK